MPWPDILARLAPEVQQFFQRALPIAQGRVQPMMLSAAHVFQQRPEMLKQVVEHAMPAAVHHYAQANRVTSLAAENEVFMHYLADTGSASKLVSEAKRAAAPGQVQVPNWVRPQLAADVQPIKYFSAIHAVQDKLKGYEATGNVQRATQQRDVLDRLVAKATGMRYPKDIGPVMSLHPGSPVTKGEYAFGSTGHPVLDMAASNKAEATSEKGLRVWWRTLTPFENMGKNRKFDKDMGALWLDTLPLQQRYYELRERIGKHTDKIQALLKATRPGQPENPQIPRLRTKVQALMPETTEAFRRLQTARYAGFQPYLDKPDVRIALYREPESRQWVQHLMQPGEVEIAGHHKGLMDNARRYGEQLKMDMLDHEREYVTHLVHKLARSSGRRLTSAQQAQMEHLVPMMAKFAHRNPGSLMFYPSIKSATESYITSASRKFAMTEFLNKWSRIANNVSQPWPGLQKFLKSYIKKYTDKRMDDTFWEKAFRAATAWEYISKTAHSLSVTRKHAEKGLNLLYQHPIDAVRTLPQALVSSMQIALQPFGVQPGAAARLMREHVAGRTLGEAWTGLSLADQGRFTQLTNMIMPMPTNFVEMFERGWVTLTALSRAQRKGLSHDQTVRGIWELMLNQCFMGRADQFLWQSKEWQRFFTIFAYTPGRIADTTIKRAIMSMREKHLVGMQNDVLQFARRMQTDAFGSKHIWNLVKLGVGAAATEAFARNVLDSTMWREVVLHFPMTREKGGEIEFYFTPWEVYSEGRKRGGGVKGFGGALLEHMLTFPQYERYINAIKGKIYPIYAGSATRQVLALPSLTAEHAAADAPGKRWEQKRIQRYNENAEKRRRERFPFNLIP